ncbi:MAG: hypothetical protein V4508_13115 [Pseudomonadota bacterium]
MSSILIQDLAHSAALDRQAMSEVRGGSAFGPDINVNVTLDQQIGQFQKIGVNVLNDNGVIGAGLVGPNLELAAAQWAATHAVVPKV